MNRPYFTFYASFYEAFADCTDDVKGRIFSAICEYALYGIEPNLTGDEMRFFILIKGRLEAGRERYFSLKEME